ncbi:hypothetical protein QVD17_30169 [Tagetes erecta]|uniref:Uncharacterized protein n=1 Tax=Tagetes erecta TaxID=13708 RepID=A0AAD8K118_TARER|nr:hypothetical protein QVD17_30169 [Tagetes erecta]
MFNLQINDGNYVAKELSSGLIQYILHGLIIKIGPRGRLIKVLKSYGVAPKLLVHLRRYLPMHFLIIKMPQMVSILKLAEILSMFRMTLFFLT